MPRMPNSKKQKDPFDALPEEWKDAVAEATVEEINLRIADVAKAEAENQRLKAEDLDLASLKEQVKDAGAVYTEGSKMNKLKIRYAMRVLGDRGIDVSGGKEATEAAEEK